MLWILTNTIYFNWKCIYIYCIPYVAATQVYMKAGRPAVESAGLGEQMLTSDSDVGSLFNKIHK